VSVRHAGRDGVLYLPDPVGNWQASPCTERVALCERKTHTEHHPTHQHVLIVLWCMAAANTIPLLR
jgi:hypothetical protein